MSIRSSKHLFKLLVFAPLLLAACAAPPREVSQNQSTEASQNSASANSTPPTSTIAVGHGSGESASAAPASAPAGSNQSGGQSAGQSGGEAKWSVPSRWKSGPEKPMRAATYLIPAASGDNEGGECAVFMNIGGGVDANIKRWIGQFEQPDGSPSGSKAKQNKETINGFQVTTVDLTGTFSGGMAMMGPMGQPGQAPGKKTGYRLLGAIVETPQGEVFFKLTGPEKSIAAAQADFQALLKSIKM